MSSIKYEFIGIGELIKNKKLKVPTYQRAYSWEEQHVNDLLDDIQSNFNASEYFLGTIVLTEKTGFSEIVDGQQRITTVFLIISAIRDLLKRSNDANTIQTTYLSTYDFRNKEYIPKLELNEQDNVFFRETVINRNTSSEPKTISNKKIIQAYDSIKCYLEKELKSYNNDENILIDWKEFLDNKLKVVVISVPDDINAFTIFETLNDRGLALAQIDLLKNYLYSKSGQRLNEIQNSWIELNSKLESFQEDILLIYIKHWWFAHKGFAREKNNELYKKIKEEIQNTTEVANFVLNLKNDVEQYTAILNHNLPFWNDYNYKCRKYVETLNYFNLEQYRPLALSILKKFEKNDVEKSLKLIVSWLIRNLIVGAMGGGTLEQLYANTAIEITKNKICNAHQLKEFLRNNIPTDDEFKEKFKTATVSKAKYARYYLAEIENFHRGKNNPELLVNLNPDSVNLEHILPENPSNNYPNFSDEDHAMYFKRIGNLTLMKTKENNDFKSSKFSDKKVKYKESEFWLTNTLANIEEWNIDAINQRQSDLAELAVETWSLKFE
jgi:uncharacterized protein with ParB-like and HNH nuclease domain